jgi:hypothetical protein
MFAYLDVREEIFRLQLWSSPVNDGSDERRRGKKEIAMNASSGQTDRTKTRRASVIAPLLLTAVGAGWLLTTQGVIPGVQWAWVLVLAVLGALVLLINGVDKVSIVIGPSLMAGALLSILRQTGRINIDTEIPVLAIVVGALWTVSHWLPLPLPSWFLTEPRTTPSGRTSDTTLPREKSL